MVLQAVLLARVIDLVLHHHASLARIEGDLVVVGVAVVIRAGVSALGDSLSHRTGHRVTVALRRQLLAKALDLGPAFMVNERSGELSAVSTTGIDSLEVYYGRYLPQGIVAAIVPPTVLVWITVSNWRAGLIAAGGIALVPIAMIHFGRKAQASNDRQWRLLASLSARFVEMVRGLSTLRAFGQERAALESVRASTEALRETTAASLQVSFLSGLSLEFIGGVSTGLVAMVLGFGLLKGWTTLSSALAVLLVTPELFVPLRRAGAEFHASKEGQVAAQRIFALLDEPSPERRVSSVTVIANPNDSGASLDVDELCVAYPERDGLVLDHLDLHLEALEHVALIGPSGSGKSTLLSVILGFTEATSGTVRIGGNSLKDADIAAWRRSISWVPQRPHLLSATLRENLLVGAPHSFDARLFEALERVGLAEQISRLRTGLDTYVGERGANFSLGERQRIALARAWLRRAPVVLLDEPVAHLDPHTEAHLRDGLDEWLSSRSVLIVAHRPELLGRIDSTIEIPSRAPALEHS